MEKNMEENLSLTEEIEIMIRARYPVIYIISWEEKRVEADLLQIGLKNEKKMFSWTSTQGLVNLNSPKTSIIPNDSTKDIYNALDNIQKAVEPALYILKDIHHYMNDPVIIRKLRDLTISLRSSFKTIIVISPILKIPPELEKDINCNRLQIT
jgi:hypothetical protein